MRLAAVQPVGDPPHSPLLRLYRRAVAIPNAAVVLKSMVGAAQLYVLTLYFQDALGRTPLEAGLLFIPMTLASVAASPVAGRLTTRLGTRHTAAWGFAMSGAGLVLVAWLMPHEDACRLCSSGWRWQRPAS